MFYNSKSNLLGNQKIFRIFLSVIISTFFLFLTVLSVSCRTTPVVVPKNVSRSIDANGVLPAEKLVVFFAANNNNPGDIEKARRLASYYVSECKIEGINSDVAFAQMCHETGFLRFGNLVTPDMNNFCGLGAIDAAHPGERFATEQQGVRAHVQHLQAYGTTRPLKTDCIDNRYKYVNPRGKAPTVFELAGTWAADRQYGAKLDAMLARMEKL